MSQAPQLMNAYLTTDVPTLACNKTLLKRRIVLMNYRPGNCTTVPVCVLFFLYIIFYETLLSTLQEMYSNVCMLIDNQIHFLFIFNTFSRNALFF